MNYIALGERIRQRRKALRLTQADLAEQADISASFLGHIERGSRVLSVQTLLLLCRALQTTPDALLAADLLAPPAELPAREQAFLHALQLAAHDLLHRHRLAE